MKQKKYWKIKKDEEKNNRLWSLTLLALVELFDDDIYSKASNILKESIVKTINKKGLVVLGLPGGRSVVPILSKLGNESICWEKVHVFMIDERLVPITHDLSNFKLIKQGLSSVLPSENMHPFIFQENELDFGIKDYGKEIMKYGGSYDIAVLSSGADGHIGSLFPNHPSIYDESEFYMLVKDAPKLPSMRMGVSKNFLLKSLLGILLFNGETKKKAYKFFLDTHVTVDECPAKLISNFSEAYIITNIKIDK